MPNRYSRVVERWLKSNYPALNSIENEREKTVFVKYDTTASSTTIENKNFEWKRREGGEVEIVKRSDKLVRGACLSKK